MRCLITGAAGFIGSNFSYFWQKQAPEDRLVLLDNLTYAGNLSTLQPLLQTPNVRFVQADIADRDAIDALFSEESLDAVVNFAAESHVDRSISDPEIFLKSNIIGVQVLLDACRRHGNIRFHQVSTDEVYGDLPLDRPDLLFTEDSALQPSSPYSASKAAADLLALAYGRTYDLPVTISRCSNNYGPYQFPEKLIPLMLIRALRNQELPLYGDGKNIRDWLHVEDHCRAIRVILAQGTAGEVYNIGGNHEQSNLAIVHEILQKLEKSTELIRFVEDRAGHDRRYAIDAGKLQRDLGWVPVVPFREGLEETISWYLSHEDWWTPLLT